MAKTFIVMAPYAWGKGDTKAQAKRRCRENLSPMLKRPVKCMIWEATPDAYVDEMGNICVRNMDNLADLVRLGEEVLVK
jgi:hypothetical protein